ncbi:MAG: AraC family transcriptional regulator [Defluviitaleaceae bacterium]|nr:AraC family transcriptional regulator [Defluviitaleaceae bacterium]
MYKMAIIDGSEYAINSLKEALEGQTWYVAKDGIKGLELIRSERPHLAFVEVHLEGIGGLEILQAVAQEKLSTLIIMVSSHAEFAYAQKALMYNAIGYCLKPYAKSELMDYLEKAVSMLGKNGTSQWHPGNIQTGNDMVDKMLDYIHSNYQNDLSVQELADLCHINYNYAGQLFRQETGETINNYLLRIRMDKASELLRTTTLSIADIAAQAGYRDYFYFAKIFKKYWGAPPSVYRSENFMEGGD